MAVLAAHVVFRGLTVVSTLTQSVVLARSLTVPEIGLYYLIATMAYVGSAAVFVGADINLQRRVADVAREGLLPDRTSLWRYFAITSFIGLGLVAAVSAAFFDSRFSPLWRVVSACCLISFATYAATIYRNSLLVSGRVMRSSAAQATDAVGKLAAVWIVSISVQDADPVGFTLGSATGSAAVLLLFATIGRWSTSKPTIRLAPESLVNSLKRILPISSSGLLNWAQTQAYRPLLAILHAPMDIVGTTSLLIGLGSTAAMSWFAVVAQVQVPKVYASRGHHFRPYLNMLGISTVCLGVLALPAGWLFLMLANKPELLPYLGLLLVGVLLEAGSAAIGVEINRANASGGSLWHLPLAGAAACAVTLAALLLAPAQLRTVWFVAGALTAGQVVAVTLVWLPTAWRTIRTHA